MSRFAHISIIATGCVAEVEGDRPMIVLPLIQWHTLGFGFRCTRGGEDQITWSELLDYINRVSVTFTGMDDFRCAINIEDDVPRRTDANVNPQLKNVVCPFIETLDWFAH